jgi:hypothetical protein
VEVGFETVIRPRHCRFIRSATSFDSMKRRRMRLTQHVTDVDYNRTGLCGDRSELVTNGMVVMAFPSRADLETVLSVTLE